MHILVVSQYFWPENFRINDLCVELVNRGHTVTVLTGKPNYPTGEFFPDFLEDSDQFNQYSGCSIVRVPIIARGKGNKLKLIANYLSYVISASLIGSWKLRKKQFDVIFVYEPSPVTVCLPAIFFKKFRKTPIAFWVLDLWPETLEAVNAVKSKKVIRAIGSLVSFIYKRCDLILGQSRAFTEGIEKYCADVSKINYFPSWAEDIFWDRSPSNHKLIKDKKGHFNILFAGNIGEAQDFPTLLTAVQKVKQFHKSIKFFVVGDGRAIEELSREIEEKKLADTIYLLGRHSLEEMPSFYQTVDALLVTLRDSSAFNMTIPGKVQSYMAAGKPILSMLSGEGSRVINEAECGYTANAGDSNRLVENIIKMASLSQIELDELGNNARSYADSQFNRDVLVTQLENWFDDLIKQRRGRVE